MNLERLSELRDTYYDFSIASSALGLVFGWASYDIQGPDPALLFGACFASFAAKLYLRGNSLDDKIRRINESNPKNLQR
tara:strand:- start:981 stop:1217 length:237 start_codon:yes stop_codon:yes gene_type:complete